jgi:hypothetical protein
MAWYKTGTISVANGGVAVTGSGTSWVAGAGIGEAISLPDGKIYEIANISSDSSLTLGSPYLGTTVSGQAYTIVPTQSYIRQLAADASSLVSSYAGVLTGAGSGKFQDGTVSLPGIAFASDVDTGIRRSSVNVVSLVAGGADILSAATGGVTVSALTSNGGIESRATLKTKFNDAYLELRQADDTRTGYIQGQGTLNRLVINNERVGGEVRIAAGGGDANLIVTPTGVVVNGTLQQGENTIFEAGRYIDFHSGGNRDYNVRFDAGPDAGVEGGSDAVLTCGTFRSTGNVGIGVTPSNWFASRKALTLSQGGSWQSSVAAVADGTFELWANSYLNSSGQPIASGAGFTTTYQQNSGGLGGHKWYTSSESHAAGATVSNLRVDMTLDASGNLLVGTTSLFGTNNNGFVYQPASGYGWFHHSTAMGSGQGYAIFTYNGTSIGSITQSGTTSVSYNTTSDHRLKTNVRPANANSFMDIQFRDFEWTDGRHDCGVIAHELQAIYPDLVTGEKDATEVRIVEIEPAVPEVPAVTEQVLVTAAVMGDDGEEIEAAVYETVEVTPAIPAVPAVTEEQTFPVYQQVNYQGLIGRMGTRVQQLQRTVDAQAAIIEAMELRLAALEAA